jgi:hypothetical protein
MKGLDAYPPWIRISLGITFMIAGVILGTWRAFGFFVAVLGFGLLVPIQKNPPLQ